LAAGVRRRSCAALALALLLPHGANHYVLTRYTAH